LIDARKPLNIEGALQSPFLKENVDDKSICMRDLAMWNDEIVETIAKYIISTGDVKDFLTASLVSKQFFSVFQHSFLSVPQFPHLAKPFDFHGTSLYLEICIDEGSMLLARMPYVQDWENLHLWADGDYAFEQDLLESYFTNLIEQLTFASNKITNFTESEQKWTDLIVHFHDIMGASSYVEQESIRFLAQYARDRAKVFGFKNNNVCKNLDDEKKYYFRIIALIRDFGFKFVTASKAYLLENGLTLEFNSNLLL